MSDETAFSKYIKSSADGYDSDIRYYRWFATADLSDKTETVNEILAARHSISPKNVLYYESDGTTEMDVAAAGEKMGAITGMSVEARSSSGSILTLDLTYECGIVKIKTEYNIRKILGCMVKKLSTQMQRNQRILRCCQVHFQPSRNRKTGHTCCPAVVMGTDSE